MSRPAPLQLSLADTARLAQVRRPVASMWRRRQHAGHAFPEPVDVVAGQERFDAFEVADYLESTGRGNNPDVRADLAAHAVLTTATRLDESTAVDGLTALLCLIAITGAALSELNGVALIGLAERADPDDRLLRREIDDLGDDVLALAAHADALADASYSPAAACDLLLRQQLYRSLPGHAAVSLNSAAQGLIARVAVALARDAGMSSPLFVDVTDGTADLLLATAREHGEGTEPSLATAALDTRCARLARRRLRIHGHHCVDVTPDADGNVTIVGDAVHVLQLPPAGDPAMSDVEVLRVIEDVVLGMDEHQRAVVIGPASALTDPPVNGELDVARDAILRTDRLRAVVRLPKGLLTRAPRQALGAWALGPAHPDVPLGERWTVVADLTDTALSDDVVGDLVTDVVAAMAGERVVRAHAFRFSRRVRTATLLASGKALVDKAVAPRRRPTGAALALTVDELVRGLAPAAISGLRVEAQGGDDAGRAGTRPGTLGQAISTRECRIVPGNRVDPAHLTAPDGPVVIGPSELIGAGAFGQRRIDLLTFAGSYPSARFTEPGDVVFCTSPHVAAWVDRAGGSVVVSPARVVRIVHHPDRGPTQLLPDVLAADIVAVSTRPGARATDWRRWPIRRVPPDQREALATTLTEIDRERRTAAERVARLDALAAAVADGVTAQALRIETPRVAAAEMPRIHTSTGAATLRAAGEEGP